MRVLVIGGTGFIGARVVERLAAGGDDVTVLHRSEHEPPGDIDVRHVHCDRAQIGDRIAELSALQLDVVLDMTAMTAADAGSTMRAVSRVASRAIVISSADVYRAYGRMHGSEPGPPEPVPLAEDAPLRERLYPYRGEFEGRFDDYDKIPVERAFAADPRVACTVLRLPAVYGERDPQHRLRAELARMDAGRPAIVIPERARTWRWSRSYVRDVADAIALAVRDERAPGRVYNVARAEAPTQEEWIRAMGEAAGWRGDVAGLPDEALPPHLILPVNYGQDLVLDSRRIREDLGFADRHAMLDGLRRTIEWERSVRAPDAFRRLAPQFAAEDEALNRASIDRP